MTMHHDGIASDADLVRDLIREQCPTAMLASGNLLARDARVTAVIDVGAIAIGDPASPTTSTATGS